MQHGHHVTKFVGWNTKADGSGTAYMDQETVTKLVSKDEGTITLYAQWKTQSYKITYELNGGKNNKDNPTIYTEISTTITLKDPTKKGYVFDGWYSDAKFENKGTKIEKGSTGDKTFYAKWSANKYHIKFDGNGSTSGSMSTLENRSYETEYKLSSNQFKRKGYTFTGWNTKKDGSGKTYKNKAAIRNLTSTNGKTVTLYAQWKKTKYTVTYKLNGGKNNSKNPASYYITTSTKKLQNPTRKGYTFKGWYSDKKCTKKVTQIKKGSTGNKTFYAKWEKKKYTITYVLNKGKNNKKNPSKYYVTTSTIKLQKPTRSGYTFKGWYSDKKCTKKVTQIKKGSTGNLKLYAKWVKKK